MGLVGFGTEETNGVDGKVYYHFLPKSQLSGECARCINVSTRLIFESKVKGSDVKAFGVMNFDTGMTTKRMNEMIPPLELNNII
eukprot:gnl/Chilomastix_caulleri/1695.p2 GENE.gnl/Chilomastix_caulleri/1695~~gnl/Chilomastix_caulleri/1695.p2  ORF type:complete len:84 (+),score=24.25 gnl/Chilomastix_caulleri/1695:201-452(+)